MRTRKQTSSSRNRDSKKPRNSEVAQATPQKQNEQQVYVCFVNHVAKVYSKEEIQGTPSVPNDKSDGMDIDGFKYDNESDFSMSDDSEEEFQQQYKINIDAMLKLSLPAGLGPHNEEGSFLSHKTGSITEESIITVNNTNSERQTGEESENE